VKNYNKIARQAGMTLIELTVVLLVLIGLAGLLIPYVSGFVTKTHDSTGSSNIQALNNAMARYEVEHYDNFPNNMDSLITAGGDVFPKMMGEMMPMMAGGSYLEPLVLNPATAASLKAVGIDSLMEMNSGENDATFANTTISKSIAAGSVVAELSGHTATGQEVLDSLSEKLARVTNPTQYHYIVTGIGEDSSIVGKTLSQVPVHFSADGDMGANKAYNHFVAIFEVLKRNACVLEGGAFTVSAGSGAVAATGTLGTVTYSGGTVPTAPDLPTLVAIADEAACDALNVSSTDVDWTDAGAGGLNAAGDAAEVHAGTDGVIDYTGVKWVTTGDKAKFMGSAMAMGMGNLEGLGGALTRYYKNTASN